MFSLLDFLPFWITTVCFLLQDLCLWSSSHILRLTGGITGGQRARGPALVMTSVSWIHLQDCSYLVPAVCWCLCGILSLISQGGRWSQSLTVEGIGRVIGWWGGKRLHWKSWCSGQMGFAVRVVAGQAQPRRTSERKWTGQSTWTVGWGQMEMARGCGWHWRRIGRQQLTVHHSRQGCVGTQMG